MKNRALKTIIFTLLISLIFSCLTVSAWEGDSKFQVSVDNTTIPDGTAYIDLLMPISSGDGGYISYNESNGEKYEISKDSEIVNYCDDGYMSYTFHIADADSDIQPHYTVEFTIADTTYEQNKELLKEFDRECYELHGEYHYEIAVTIGNEKEQRVNDIKNKLNIEAKNCNLRVEFNESVGRESEYDFDYCRQKYKYAKMAYLDKDGNVLLVSEKAKIKSFANQTAKLQLKLSGKEFASDISTGSGFSGVILVIYMFVLPFVILMIIVVVVSNKKVKKLRNN